MAIARLRSMPAIFNGLGRVAVSRTWRGRTKTLVRPRGCRPLFAGVLRGTDAGSLFLVALGQPSLELLTRSGGKIAEQDSSSAAVIGPHHFAAAFDQVRGSWKDEPQWQ